MRIKKLAEFGFNTNRRTYAIAEIGINHEGSLQLALQMIVAAARAGYDAVKFQTYQTDMRVDKSKLAIYEILKRCELPFSAFRELKDCAEENKVDFLSTPFDKESVACLETIDTQFYKVASVDVTNLELLRTIGETKKPVILSVGMANKFEIDEALNTLLRHARSVTLLHCVSAYPLDENHANLGAIYDLQEAYDCVVGYSDHTKSVEIPLMAVAAGAQVIEKHFMLNNQVGCIDAPVSIDEDQSTKLCSEIQRVESIFGLGGLKLSEIERPTAEYRRHTL